MMQLHQDQAEFEKRDTLLVAIGPESKEDFKKYWEENELDFYGIPDSDHRVLELYGQEVKILKMGRMPAQILVDKEAIVRFTNYGKSMKDIAENEEILKIIDGL